jgi:beta-lactamase class A
MGATYAVSLQRSGWIVRTAIVAGIAFSLAMAVVGGVLFGHAVTSSPAEAPPEIGAERPSPAKDGATTRDKPEHEPWPAQGAAAEAERIAKVRSGLVSFAAIGPGGRAVSYEPDRQFYSASVSKAMLLIAELRRLNGEGTTLDEGTRSLLEQMITVSDNAAADAIYERVGDPGLNAVAELAGMSGFEGDVGHWSNVKITAADMALFMSKLDELLDLPSGEAGSEMLASVTPAQRWGIPQAAPEGADVLLKGGWRPSDTGQLVHQAAQVKTGGEVYSIAVLTDGNPSQPYGEETIRLIAAELLAGG